jgi:hypothetical protein
MRRSISILGVFALIGCQGNGPPVTLEEISGFLGANADSVHLSTGGTNGVVLSPALQGRIMTARVGEVQSTGYVPFQTIAEGETHEHFNNFGGLDRFWIGPEAGQFGIYFPPGSSELTRDNWQVPADFDTGEFAPIEVSKKSATMTRNMTVTNLKGVEFQVKVERTAGILDESTLATELGVSLPEGVSYVGCYSDNKMTNTGDHDWDPAKGLLGIWILGMFNATDRSAVIAPFNVGEESALGPAFNDEYFGKVSKDTPNRLKIVDNAVIFRGDARKVGKFGLNQRRTKGIAGSYDFGKNLLTVVRFSVPETPERYGNSTWDVEQAEPYAGDVFQSYNNGDDTKPGEVAGDAFYEIESASPVRPLKRGESIEHRHATHHFQGSPEKLAALAKELLGVDLAKVKAAMGW